MAGEIDLTDDRVLVVSRIRVSYTLRATLDDEARGKLDRAMQRHTEKCPVARTIGDCVEISTEIRVVEG